MTTTESRNLCPDDGKFGMLVAFYAVNNANEWLAHVKKNDGLNPRLAEDLLRVVCSETIDKGRETERGVILHTYPLSDEDIIKEYIEVNAMVSSDSSQVITPSVMTFELLVDRWEIDPASLPRDEKLAIYIGGHGVLNFDSWLKIFKDYPHSKDFPGIVRILAGKGTKHADGTETCVYVHLFKRSCEKEVHKLLFGEEKKLRMLEHSVILPYHPDIYADVAFMSGSSLN
jgi:hypothetical protein